MPTIHIPDATYQHLTAQAAIRQVTVETLTAELLEHLATPPAAAPPADDWRAELAAWKRDAEARADRYPPGHTLDVSREAMYDDRLRGQL